ncbi:uncharacterized protein LOC134477339 [Cavia porcellus]|uniref:uncharacterized protein LOC134477339 n=1 Tax=Cavia porcellus TaxID=10141 RepID=UPI002FE1ACBF
MVSLATSQDRIAAQMLAISSVVSSSLESSGIRNPGAGALRSAPRLTKWQCRHGALLVVPGKPFLAQVWLSSQGRDCRPQVTQKVGWPRPHLKPGSRSETKPRAEQRHQAGGGAGHPDQRCRRRAPWRATWSKPRAEQPAAPGGTGPGAGSSRLPRTLRRQDLALTCRGGAARASEDPAADARVRRPRPARGPWRAGFWPWLGSARAGLGLRLPRRGCSRRWGEPGRAVWRRQVLRLQLWGRQLPARDPRPGRSPPRHQLELRRSRPPQWAVLLPPGPASTDLPRPPAGARSVRPVPTGTLRPGEERDSPRSSRTEVIAGPEL